MTDIVVAGVFLLVNTWLTWRIRMIVDAMHTRMIAAHEPTQAGSHGP